MFSTFEKQQAKPVPREKTMMIQEGPTDTDMGSFGGIDDFMMHNLIDNQQQYQSHPQINMNITNINVNLNYGPNTNIQTEQCNPIM